MVNKSWVFSFSGKQQTVPELFSEELTTLNLGALSIRNLGEMAKVGGVYVAHNLLNVFYVGKASIFGCRLGYWSSGHHVLPKVFSRHTHDAAITILPLSVDFDGAARDAALHKFERECIEHYRPIYNGGALLDTEPTIFGEKGYVTIAKDDKSNLIHVQAHRSWPLGWIKDHRLNADSILIYTVTYANAISSVADIAKANPWLHASPCNESFCGQDEKGSDPTCRFNNTIFHIAAHRQRLNASPAWGFWFKGMAASNKPRMSLETLV